MSRALRMPAVCALAVSLLAGGASADSSATDTRDVFRSGVAALDRGAPSEAIAQFELLADRGFQHPDASFNRAVAYIERARSPRAESGDLGRAAAALEETLLLRPDDPDADAALDVVRAEIARRRSRRGADPVSARPAPARALASLADENVWAGLAVLGSWLLTLGLVLRRRRERAGFGLAGTITAGVAAVLMLSAGTLTLLAREFRTTSRAAVVVVREARLLDEDGSPITSESELGSTALPEGEKVWVDTRRGRLARVQWGSVRAWVSAGQLRMLPDR